MLELLIKEGADSESRDDKGQTPLFHAQKARTAKLLLVNGANVNVRDADGQTPLHVIAYKSFETEFLELLIAKGAGVRVFDSLGRTPLHYQFLGFRPRHPVARALDVYIAHGADINAQDYDGNTPLHLAVLDGYSTSLNQDKAIGALLDAGADATLVNADAEMPWEVAEDNENLMKNERFITSDAANRLREAAVDSIAR